MTRPLRIEFPGAWYHVMNGAAGRRRIFIADRQRRLFLSLLHDVHARYAAEIHAYCLMDDHYHLLLRTPEANLQRIMRHINGLYTQYFNRNQGTDGSLFRGRYKAILVDADAYWLELSRYVHRNPVAVGAARHPEQHPWSSYRAYVGSERKPDWLTTTTVLSAVGRTQRVARYKAFVERAGDEKLAAFYRGPAIGPILGDDAFRARFTPEARTKAADQPDLRRASPRPDAATIAAATAARFGVDLDTTRISTRGKGVTSPARSVAMYLCQQAGDMRLAAIADYFGLASYASAGATIRNVRRRLETDPWLARMVQSILLDLTP